MSWLSAAWIGGRLGRRAGGHGGRASGYTGRSPHSMFHLQHHSRHYSRVPRYTHVLFQLIMLPSGLFHVHYFT
ncbi:hypothetical protein E2C01_066407 [Portunus trituberculatus]|uniref:Uncharacterized protein n=1 Tax=Portunus trituberculatus TaxID=210409 RepID=A0A5B7HPN9_PORTR|nr:hypothetical protein [Portunus trituberculatus]